VKKEVQTKLAWQMLESARLTGSEVNALLDQALNPDYWRHLLPALTVGATECEICEAHSLDPSEVTKLVDKFETEGYFRTGPVLPLSLMERMRTCVERLRKENWPLVFAFVFDEFWMAIGTASLQRLLAALLPRGYKQNSAIWTYYVAARTGAKGWTPHIDGGGQNRLSVWLPLTDATLDNGCMYVVPKNLIPHSLPADYMKWETIERSELDRLLQCSRALPAEAGALLGWDHNLIHWGSISSGSGTPRISIAVEFLGADATPSNYDRPLLDTASLPPFKQRLYIIGKCILDYEKFEPLMIRFDEVGKRLIALNRYNTLESFKR
jgi:hypothetical protein